MATFVYCWTDHVLNMLYIGVHRGAVDDGYICSSKSMIKNYKTRPNTFTRQIVAIGNDEEMRNFEHMLLISSDAANSQYFYNTGHGGGRLYRKGVVMTAEHRQKISRSKTGKVFSETHKTNLAKARREMGVEKLTCLASLAGKASAQARLNDCKYKGRQSERMKLIWQQRKSQNVGQ